MDQPQLAEALGMKVDKISRAESGQTKSVDILLDIQDQMKRLGIIFLPSGGVDISSGYIQIIEGKDCYIKLLKNILVDDLVEELLIMFASDKVSPPKVIELYRYIRKNGVQMRQLIKEGDTYIMGELNEYRTIPEKYFTNTVTLVYGNCVAQVNSDETKIVIYNDSGLSKHVHKNFNYYWDHGGIPEKSTADERF